MLKRILLAAVAAVVLSSVSAFAGPKTGCKKFNFIGSYLSPDLNADVFGDASATHSFVYQLTVHSDGTADQYWTGLPDYMINLGTGSHQIGSWTCRDDGKLLITLIQGSYIPASIGSNPNVQTPDVQLFRHNRTTYLFSVDDDNTLTKIQSRARRYTPAQDPSDASSGALAAINNNPVTYKRLTSSDADLLAP